MRVRSPKAFIIVLLLIGILSALAIAVSNSEARSNIRLLNTTAPTKGKQQSSHMIGEVPTVAAWFHLGEFILRDVFSLAPVKTADSISAPVAGEPSLGDYPDITVDLSADTTIIPSVPPTNISGIQVTSSFDFLGKLSADPITGELRITNARPANRGTAHYLIIVRGFGPVGAVTKTFSLTVSNGQRCEESVGFVPGSSSFTGAFPVWVSIGDLNNDGNQDLVITNHSSGTVSIRLGDGMGGFTGNSNLSLGSSPSSVAIADFNSDGNQDLAVGSSVPGLNIAYGDGQGHFPNNAVIPGTISSRTVVAADLNHDGNVDLAYTSGNSGNFLVIRLGDGNGGFSLTGSVPL